MMYLNFVTAVKVVMLCLAWKLKAEQMGFFTLNEWMCGMTELQYVLIFCSYYSSY